MRTFTVVEYEPATDATDTPTTPAKPTQLDLPWSEQDRTVFSQAAETHAVEAATRRRQLSELAAVGGERRPIGRALLVHPTVFVQVPRAVAAHYGQQPWADVLAAAEGGLDGLLVTAEPRLWKGQQGERPPEVPDVAFLAEGQDEWRGRTVLYQQNW